MYYPKLDEFLTLATQGNVIPVSRRLLADIETPLSAYRKIRGPGESFLFESVEGGEHLGRYSFVGCNPRAVVRQTGARVETLENGKIVSTFQIRRPQGHEARPFMGAAMPNGVDSLGGPASSTISNSQGGVAEVKDGLEVIEGLMKKYRPCSVPGLPRFTGGAVGFIGYEFIHDVEPVVPCPHSDELHTPVMYFLIADQLLIFDRVAQTLTVLVNAILEDAGSPEEAYENAVGEIDRIVSLLEQPSEHHPVTVPDEVASIPFVSNLAEEKFFANVAKAKEYITSGDIIQVVGSQRFSVPIKSSPLD